MRGDAERGQEGLEHQMRVQQHERALQRVQAAGRHGSRHRARIHLRRGNDGLLALWLLHILIIIFKELMYLRITIKLKDTIRILY